MFIVSTLLVLLPCFLVVEGLLFLLYRVLPFLDVEEFPPVTEDILAKFTTFDADLGWVPQPDTVKVDKDTMSHTRYTIDASGGRALPVRRDSTLKISTYGDSTCFCREVRDDETWQYYLGEELGVDVSNYGVGNYGLDQALLRLKREFDSHPADCVIMAVTPWTIMRILSVWKHYSEFGNTLASKPRYVLREGQLVFVPNRVRRKEDLAEMSDLAEWLRANDYHYRRFFMKHRGRFPRVVRLIEDPALSRKILFSTLLGLAYYGKLRGLVNLFHYQRTLYELEYKARLFRSARELLRKVLGEFVAFAREKRFKPVLLMLPGYEDIRFMRSRGNYYRAALDAVNAAFEELTVVDFYPELDAVADPATLFTRSKYGWPGHYSAASNRHIARVLARELADEFMRA